MRHLVVAGLITWLAAAAALHLAGSGRDDAGAVDVIAVPGCGVRDDGSPSACLDRRVRAAVELWKAGRAPKIVLSGGRTGGPKAEAVVGAELAQTLGVPPGALKLEVEAQNTWGNAVYTARLLREPQRVLVVTDTGHLWRATHLYAAHHAAVLGHAVATPWDDAAWLALREALAVPHNVVTGRLPLTTP